MDYEAAVAEWRARRQPRYDRLAVFAQQLDRFHDTQYSIIRGHMLSEQLLHEYIASYLPNAAVFDLGRVSYPVKVDLAAAISSNPIPHLRPSLHALNRLRNRCAHRVDYQLALSDIDALVSEFGPDWHRPQNEHFSSVEHYARNAVMYLLTIQSAELWGPHAEYGGDLPVPKNESERSRPDA